MPENKNNFISGLLFVLYLVFLISLIFSIRAINSISVPCILGAGLIKNKIEKKKLFSPNLKNPPVVSCCLFFLLQLCSLLYARDSHQGMRNAFLYSAIVIIPASFFCCNYLNAAVREKILKWYCIALFAACLFATFEAFKNYSITHKFSVFLYHSLVSVYSAHAIQFSIIVFIALVYLIKTAKRKEFLFGRLFHFFLTLFFIVFIFFLSSKLVIVYFLLYSIFELARSFKLISKSIVFFSGLALAILLVFILIVPNPIGNRFKEIIQTNFDFLKKEKYDPGEYFNGLQFRMLQWRFVPQILNERKAWLKGVSIGDAQACLNQKYISEDMYVGSPARGDKGFIGYNTHNEFLEALLQTGIPGLLLFIMITAAFIKMMIERKNSSFIFVTLLLVIYSFTESVFETQYSLFMYFFFPLFFYVDNSLTGE